ncbi:MAG: ABC transporter permease [Burkholderiales bacterium]
MNDFLISMRFFLRDWRSGELTVLFLALLVAVSSMTTVEFFADRVKGALQNQAEKMLGADLVLISDHPLDDSFASMAAKRGIAVTSAVKFPSMVSFDESSVLAEIKAIGAGYPLRGKLRLSNGLKGVPERGTVWVDRKLLTRLNLPAGSRVEIGEADFTVAAVVVEEPEAAFSFMSLGPGLIMNAIDLPSTRLIQEGSRVQYIFYAAGDVSAIASYREWAKSRLGRGQSLEDAREGSPQVKAMLDRSEIFLGMAALLSVVLAAVAIALSARRFVERHLDGCAVMRVMGATGARLFRLYLHEFSMLGLLSGLIGAAIGFVAQNLLAAGLSSFIGVQLPTPSLRPLVEGGATAMLLLLGFALPPVLALAKVPALHVMRRQIAPPRAGYAIGLVALGVLFLWQADDAKLGLILFGAFGGMLALSALFTRLLLQNLKIDGMGWKYGLANLKRRSASSVIQVIAFGLGLMAILVLTLVRGNLFDMWQESLPINAPNRFVLNIQPNQLDALSGYFDRKGLAKPEFFPMVRGRLTGINGRSVSSENYRELRAKRLVDREFNLSWAAKLQSGNEIVAGKWWGMEGRGKPELSVEEGLAETLSIHMGDTLTFEVAGSAFSGKVANLRKVNWNSFRVNFFVLAPPGVLEDYPRSYITNFHLPPGNHAAMNDLARDYPNLLVIDVSSMLAKMQKMMNQAALAMEFVFLYSLAAGGMVLIAAFSSTQDERMREAAILRTLGASRRQVLAANASEFLILGGLSGLFGAMGATAVDYLASRKLLDLSFHFDPTIALAGIALGSLAILLMGLFWTRKALAVPPSVLLRSLG